MGEFSKIAWCDHTFNGWIGCAKVSEACRFCYAETQTYPRVSKGRGLPLWGPSAHRHITSPSNWKQPIRWNRAAEKAGVRAKVFAHSLSDVAEDRRDLDEPRAWLSELIRCTPWLTWLLLTKRPENLVRLFPRDVLERSWVGTTAEDQYWADKRWDVLSRVPAAVRWMSMEPLFGDIVMHRWATVPDWIVIGGESGSSARPFDFAHARALLCEAREFGISFFMKQGGACALDTDWNGLAPLNLRDPMGGNPEEWPRDLRIREFPNQGANL